MARTYRFISADGHFESPPEMWTHRVPAEYRDRAPRRIKLADGRDAIVNEGEPLTYGGTSWYGGGPPEQFDPTRIIFANTPGTGGPEQRLREMDEDGIDAEVLFALGVRNRAIRDTNAFLAVIRGFNDYFAEEYCAVDRERLIGVAVLPNAGADEDIAEMERCTRMGLKAVWLSTYPSGKGYPSDEDDRFWAAAIDMGVPLIVHTSFPARVGAREVALLKYPREPEGEDKPPTDLVQRLARQGPYHSGALEAAQMVVSGLFERFPKAPDLLGGEQRRMAPLLLRADRPRVRGQPVLGGAASRTRAAEEEAERVLARARLLGVLRGPRGDQAAVRGWRGPHALVDRLPTPGHALAAFPRVLRDADRRRAGGREVPVGSRQRHPVLRSRLGRSLSISALGFG